MLLKNKMSLTTFFGLDIGVILPRHLGLTPPHLGVALPYQRSILAIPSALPFWQANFKKEENN